MEIIILLNSVMRFKELLDVIPLDGNDFFCILTPCMWEGNMHGKCGVISFCG